MPENYKFRHTKVIFTLGPATMDPDKLKGLLNCGVDICRLNMAHADHDWVRNAVKLVRQCCREVGREVAILMDVKGPEIRTGALEEDIELHKGDTFDFFVDPDTKPVVQTDGPRGVAVNYPGLGGDLKVGDNLLVDSGLLQFQVVDIDEERVRCEVRIGGTLGSRRHINLPGIKVSLPSLTEKDRRDIRVGIEVGIDFYALSFVREPDDVDIMRRFLNDNGSNARIVAKIEDQSAITNLDDIITAADALMVARGDLGIEIPYETLPMVQKAAVTSCLRRGKPVIVATHMLESMITQPVPTRAEITDVANAAIEQADCVMLSGETATGKYPIQCVEVLNRVIGAIEIQDGTAFNPHVKLRSSRSLMLRSAVILSHELPGSCILAFTRRGYIPSVLSVLRPRRAPIYAFTDDEQMFRNMMILWGVEPFLMEFEDDPERTILKAMTYLKEKEWVQSGQIVITISNVVSEGRMIDTIQLRDVD